MNIFLSCLVCFSWIGLSIIVFWGIWGIKYVLSFKNNFIITVEKRQNDYTAYFNNDKKLWGCGKSKQEAIGNVILIHGKDLGIKIIDNKEGE